LNHPSIDAAPTEGAKDSPRCSLNPALTGVLQRPISGVHYRREA
jgi:hypothetical protein